MLRAPFVAVLALMLAVPLAPAEPLVVSPCAPEPASLDPLDTSCAPIRPGARMANGCTLNFVVTDGSDLYVGTAGHCASLGDPLVVAGAPGAHGSVVFDAARRDYAFFRIDPASHGLVDPTMSRFAGPTRGPTGANVRDPLAGEMVYHYGHGVSAGSMEETRARAGPVVLMADNPVGALRIAQFVFVSNANGGDSGSPVRLATGEAAGILVAAGPVLGYNPAVLIAEPFSDAMADLAAALGRPVRLVEGRAPIET